MGKFLTSAGGELIDAPHNDMFSRTLLFGLAIPFVHTGIKASRTIITHEDGSSLLDASFGVANGWGNHNVGSSFGGGPSNGNFPTWLMTASISPSDMFSATVNYFVGETTQTGSYRNLIDIVASVKPMDDFTLSFNFDWVSDEAAVADPVKFGNLNYGDLWGLAAIARYDFAVGDKKNWYGAMRVEFFDDHEGVALGVTNNEIWGLTWTLGYKPLESLLLRTEVRWDEADANIYENGSSSSQVTASFDASFLF